MAELLLPEPITPARPDPLPPGLFSGPRDGALDAIKEVWVHRDDARLLQERLAAIDGNRLLSVEGLKQQRDAARKVAAERLAKGMARVDELQAGLTASYQRLDAEAAPLPNEPAAIARHTMLVQMLLGKSDEQLSLIVQRATLAGDRETLSAVAHLPAGLAPGEEVVSWRQSAFGALRETVKPGTHAELEQSKWDLDMARSMLRTIKLYAGLE